MVDCPKTESMSKKTSMISSVKNSKILLSTTEFKPCNLRMEHCLNMIASLHSSSLVECQDQVDIVLWKSPCLLDGWPQQIIPGTTLMRAMLDAHHDVRCGEETRVVPRLLQVYLSQPNKRHTYQSFIHNSQTWVQSGNLKLCCRCGVTGWKVRKRAWDWKRQASLGMCLPLPFPLLFWRHE